MGAQKVEANYEMLAQISQKFAQQAECVQQLLTNVQGKMDTLTETWAGQGSEAFFSEMQDVILPATNRLMAAMQQAGTDTQQISQTMSQAEENASSVFQCLAG